MSAAFLSVPLRLWFRPWQYSDSVGERGAWAPSCKPPNQRAACTMSASFKPHNCATYFGVNSRTRSRSASKPTVCAAM